MTNQKDVPRAPGAVQAQPGLETWPFAAIVQASDTPTLLTDPRLPDNPIVFVNDAFLRLTGYGRDEILGRNCRFLRGPETDRETSKAVWSAVEEARAVSMRLLNYRKDGSAFWNQLHISPIFDEVGMLTYFVGYQHDVTAEVEADRAMLRRHQDEMEEALCAGPAATWEEAGKKALYLITLFAGTAEGHDPRHRQLIASALEDIRRLSGDPRAEGGPPGGSGT